MGYELHITRAENWFENKDDVIDAQEWLRLIAADPELTLDTHNGPYFAVWSGPSVYEEPWFNWLEGDIHTKNPDKEMLVKMLQIADALGAKVQGDDGEIYRSEEDHPGLPMTSESLASDDSGMPAYERRERIWNLVTYGTIALVIAAAVYFDLW